MIVDYFVLRRQQLALDDLYSKRGRYRYLAGVNPIAVVAFVAGIAPLVPGFLAQLDGSEVSPFFTTLYSWSWFVAFLSAGLVYFIGMFAFWSANKFRA